MYKLSYPNNGFVNGSIEENRNIYENFFKRAKLSFLSVLLVTIDGNLREEDFLVLTLAEQFGIQTAIIRTKLDEWLDNRPKNQTNEEYVENDKNFILKSLHNLGLNFPREQIYNISSLAMIVVAEDGPQSDMAKYQQDDQLLLTYLHKITVDAKPFSMQTNYPQNNLFDVVVVGLRGAGKSTLTESLRRIFGIPGKNVMEISYEVNTISSLLQ